MTVENGIRILYIVPRVATQREIARRMDQIPTGFLDPSTQVEVKPVLFSGYRSDSYFSDALTEIAVLRAGYKAEEQGFHAVCMDTVSDAALFPLRSRLSIPVIGPGLLAFHLAGVLGRRFTILTTWERWAHLYSRTVSIYGLGQCLASVRHIDGTPDIDWADGEQARKYTPRLLREARLAIEEDGADVLVLGSTTMSPVASTLAANCLAPVINPGPWACKIAESLVKLGLSHSKLVFEPPTRNLDDLLLRIEPK